MLAVAATAGSAQAGVLTYEYTGFQLFADEEANARYLEFLEVVDEDDPVDEEIFDAARSPTSSGLTFSFSVDEASLPGGSIRGQSITEDDASSLPGYVEFYEQSGGFSLDVTFDARGKVVDWGIFGAEELEFISIRSSGDAYGYDPIGFSAPTTCSSSPTATPDDGSGSRATSRPSPPRRPCPSRSRAWGPSPSSRAVAAIVWRPARCSVPAFGGWDRGGSAAAPRSIVCR